MSKSDVDAAPDMLLHMDVLEPFAAFPGAAMKIAVNDGWVIPAASG